MTLNWKAAVTVGTIHALSSAIVFAVIWHWMGKIFWQHREVLIFGYVVCSLVMSSTALLFEKKVALIAIAALVPYVSSELGYFIYLVIWRLDHPGHRDLFANIAPMLFVPFLLTAGPIISIFNGLGYLALMLELEEYKSKRKDKQSSE